MKSATTLIPQAQVAAPVRVVIDTNAALDLWAFKDPGVHLFRAALEDGTAQGVACPAMRRELVLVLERGVAAAHGAQAQAVLANWDRTVQLVPDPGGATPGPLQVRMVCRDADDQVFIDLALQQAAKYLLTSDRDLLALRRRAARIGLVIQRPQVWRLEPLPQCPLQG